MHESREMEKSTRQQSDQDDAPTHRRDHRNIADISIPSTPKATPEKKRAKSSTEREDHRKTSQKGRNETNQRNIKQFFNNILLPIMKKEERKCSSPLLSTSDRGEADLGHGTCVYTRGLTSDLRLSTQEKTLRGSKNDCYLLLHTQQTPDQSLLPDCQQLTSRESFQSAELMFASSRGWTGLSP